MVDLDGTVDEVKQQIRDAEDPDYSELLEQEKEGKDRKTIKEFLQKRIDDSEDEVDEVEEIQEEMSDEQEEVEEELVEEIEEDTQGRLLAGFTGPQLLTGGALLGLVLGLVVGAVALPMNPGISPDQAEQKVSTLLTAGGQLTADQISIDTMKRGGMYYMNVTAQVQGVNGTTRTQSQAYYMSTSGQLMFPEQIRTPFGAQRVAIDIDRAIAQAQQPEQPANQTQQQPSGNQTQ
ncbi:MAG: hypothetical protein ABEK16_05615 [Candidatus Nanohalobium sp.]